MRGRSPANDISYTWPSTQTGNFFLQTNGAGTLDWVLVSTSSAAGWTDSGSIVHLQASSDRVGIGYTDNASGAKLTVNGNVGIGTTNPAEMLEVYDGDIRISNQGSNPAALYLWGDRENSGDSGDVDGVIGFRTDNSDLWGWNIEALNYATLTDLAFRHRVGGVNYDVLYLDGTSTGGNVGIGTTNPASALHISGDTTFQAGTASALVIPGLSALTGAGNSVAGSGAGVALISGTNNTLFGVSAGNAIVAASNNIFIGYQAGLVNTESDNIAIGFQALDAQTSGGLRNLAIGSDSLGANTTGDDNIGIGYNALLVNTSGNNNVALGSLALDANVSSWNNTAIGNSTLTTNTGGGNTAIGSYALANNTTASNNIAIGYFTKHGIPGACCI